MPDDDIGELFMDTASLLDLVDSRDHDLARFTKISSLSRAPRVSYNTAIGDPPIDSSSCTADHFNSVSSIPLDVSSLSKLCAH